MRAGRLDRRITIQRKESEPSDSGEPIDTWETLATVWASMSPVRGDERFDAPQLIAGEQIEFRVRWSSILAGLNALDRIIYPTQNHPHISHIHDILAVHEIGRREGLQIIAWRRADVLDDPDAFFDSTDITFDDTSHTWDEAA